jgi:hypothetical protein
MTHSQFMADTKLAIVLPISSNNLYLLSLGISSDQIDALICSGIVVLMGGTE